MSMTVEQSLITIGVIMLATVLTRYLPFVLFPDGRETPKYVQHLAKVLPPAVLGMLVIYCYKSVEVTGGNHGLPEILAGVVVVALQSWKKNMFLSLLAGTACYMILIRLPVFM